MTGTVRRLLLTLCLVTALVIAPAVTMARLASPITACVAGQLHVFLFDTEGNLVAHVTSPNWGC